MQKTKAEIRKEISNLTKEILPKDDYGVITSIEICKKILSSSEYKIADTIFIYMALPDEVNLTRLIADAFVAGKRIFAPRINKAKNEMTFHEITPEKKLETGSFDILEPPKDDEPVDLEEILNSQYSQQKEKYLVFIPGRAFTNDGKRLGRGGGYYDRFLQKYGEKITKIGVCFPFQILDELPTEETDCMVDSLFTAVV